MSTLTGQSAAMLTLVGAKLLPSYADTEAGRRVRELLEETGIPSGGRPSRMLTTRDGAALFERLAAWGVPNCTTLRVERDA